MPVFAYKAANPSGKTVEGKIEAGGRGEAARMIEQQGLMPLRLTESASGTAATKSSKGANLPAAKMSFGFQSKKVSFSELEDFTRSLASLLAAHVPLSRALTILYKECSSPAAATKWRELHDMVIDGMPLAEAMGRSPEVLSLIHI